MTGQEFTMTDAKELKNLAKNIHSPTVYMDGSAIYSIKYRMESEE